MITIKDLSVSYDKESVLHDLNLEVKEGLIHGLVGMNGSGKTTLLNTVYGYITPDKGKILREGKALIRGDIGYLPAENYFYSNITGNEYLNLFPLQNLNFNLELWQEVLQLPLDELVDNFSTGMKKKLALLALMKKEKPVMILDEPFNGLDMDAAHSLKLVIEALHRKGKTIIVTSHILESLTGICNQIHYLRDKKIEKTFAREEFSTIAKEVFHELEKKKRDLIDKAF